MSKSESPTVRNPSGGNISCAHCGVALPPQAVYCSSCGQRVRKMQGEKVQKSVENGDSNTQLDGEADTVRLASFPKRQPSLQVLESHAISEPISIEPSQVTPTPPTPPMPESWQDVPDTDTSALLLEEVNTPSVPTATIDATNHSADASKTQRKAVQASPWMNFLWPVMIILSAIAAWLVNFVFTAIPVRPLLVFWFLFFCPGMVLVRFLRLHEPVVEWMLALALSLTIDALVAAVQLYAGRWSTSGTLSIVIGLSLSGAIIQLITALSTAFISKRPQKSHTE